MLPEAKAILAVRPELRRCRPSGVGGVRRLRLCPREPLILQRYQRTAVRLGLDLPNAALGQKGEYFKPRSGKNKKPWSRKPTTRSSAGFLAEISRATSMVGERIGMSLTGGLDTRMIVAWHKPLLSKPSLVTPLAACTGIVRT